MKTIVVLALFRRFKNINCVTCNADVKHFASDFIIIYQHLQPP